MWKKITDSKWFYMGVSLLWALVLWVYVGQEGITGVGAPVGGIMVTGDGLAGVEERGLMVCEGADDVTVNAQITQAVSVLTGVSTNRISISKMS